MEDMIGRISSELDRLYTDASWSAQTYFEAAKSAEFYGRLLVFLPALISAITSTLVAVGQTRSWGALGAVAGAVAATAAFLGSERKATSYKESARRYTLIRQEAQTEKSLLGADSPVAQAEEKLRALRKAYAQSVERDEPTPNRAFKRADKRISEGALRYDDHDAAKKSSAPPK